MNLQKYIHPLIKGGQATLIRILAMLVSLLFGIAVTRIFGATDFGHYVTLMAIAGILATVLTFGLPSLITREVASSRGTGDVGLLSPIARLVVLGFVITTVVFVSAAFWRNTDLVLISLFAAFANLAAVLAALYAGYELVIRSAWINTVFRPMVAIAALAVFGTLLESGKLGALLSQILGALAALIFFLFRWNRDIGLSLTGLIKRSQNFAKHYSSLLRSGMVLAAIQVMINLTTQVDVLLLSALTTPEEVAYYYAAARAALVVSIFHGTSAMVMEPRLARMLAAGERQTGQNEIRSTLFTSSVVTGVLSVLMIVLAPFYLDLYGRDFRIAIPAMIILGLGLAVHAVFGPAQAVLRVGRSDSSVLYITGFCILVNVGISLLLIPVFGITGAAMGTACQFVLYGLLLSLVVKTRMNLRSDIFYKGFFFNGPEAHQRNNQG